MLENVVKDENKDDSEDDSEDDMRMIENFSNDGDEDDVDNDMEENRDGLRRATLNNGDETTDMPSMESAASNSHAEDLNSASSSGNMVDIFILV